MDRMEIIRIHGYTEDEKIEIARRHLIEKQLDAHGLKSQEWSISDPALRDVIRYYTREAGVRNLEREIANLTRKATKEILMTGLDKVTVSLRNLEKFAGVRKFRFGEIESMDLVGVTNGLAWTEVGGEILTIEAVMVPGKGKMIITGKLGEVMQESIQAARSFVQSRSQEFGVKPTIFEKRDIHVHVPEGATPKDGPSAGVGMVTSIVSMLTGIPVSRDVAMTGEITLRGRVLPIGGLKEKLLAALRGGITRVLVPKENEKDLADIPENIKRSLEIVPVTNVEEVLEYALVNPLVPIEWKNEEEDRAAVTAGQNDDDGEHTGLLKH
jgi:ATP-dependent Lon protease